jgi:predicted phage terminase large subunit-like protein
VSVAFVAWLLGHEPAKQIICASYGQALADKHARDTRIVMSSEFYKQIFPMTRLSPLKQSVNDFMTTEHGFRMATSVGGALTGRGGDILIIDDPQKPDEALSETSRRATNEWFSNTLQSRLNNKEDGIIIIVMQRLHQNDLVGHVLDQGSWDVLSFPAIAQEDEIHRYSTPFGECTYRRRAGEVLDPRRESLATLEEIKRTIGEYNFYSQYQQTPIPVGGAMVKLHWLQYYDPAAPLPSFSHKLQSWDTANKSGELNDYSVCTTWGMRGDHYYLLDVVRKRLDYPNLKRQVVEQSRKWSSSTIIIEDKASGTQLIQDLRSEGQFRVKPYEPTSIMDKVMRLHAQTAEFENGRVLLPSSAPWLAEYIAELTGFPGSRYDDQVDSTTQALDYLKTHRGISIWHRLGEQA